MISVRTSGLSEFAARLGELQSNVHVHTDSLLRAQAEELRDEIASRAPLDTHELVSSIRTKESGDGRFTVEVGAPHAIHVEYGTVKQEPQPFIRPAVEAMKLTFRTQLLGFLRSLWR